MRERTWVGWLPLCCCARGRVFTGPEEASLDSLLLPQRSHLDEAGIHLSQGVLVSQAALLLRLDQRQCFAVCGILREEIVVPVFSEGQAGRRMHRTRIAQELDHGQAR